MGGFIRAQPGRIVVSEIISDGVTQKTGITGWTAQFAATRYNSWATPRPPSSSAYVMSVQMASTSAALTCLGFSSSAGSIPLNSPDYPRAVRIIPSTSAFVAANSSSVVLVNGTDQFGVVQQDSISLGNGAGPIDGQIAFKTITSIVIPACSSTGGVPFTVGLSNIFGLDRVPGSVAGIISGSVNGTAETTRPLISAPSTSGYVSPAAAVPVLSRATAKFSTSATSSAGALLEAFFVPQDTTHI